MQVVRRTRISKTTSMNNADGVTDNVRTLPYRKSSAERAGVSISWDTLVSSQLPYVQSPIGLGMLLQRTTAKSNAQADIVRLTATKVNVRARLPMLGMPPLHQKRCWKPPACAAKWSLRRLI